MSALRHAQGRRRCSSSRLRLLGCARFRGHVLARRRHRGAQYFHIADVIREQQDELGVDERALLVGQIAVQVDQLFVEIVGRSDVRFGVEHDERSQWRYWPVAWAIAARTWMRSNVRQRAQTCWSGRK